MPKIIHCGRRVKPAKKYKIPQIKGFSVVYLFATTCQNPTCQKTAYGWYGVDIFGERHEWVDVNKKAAKEWEFYIQSGIAIPIKNIRQQRPTHSQVFGVSDYTRLIHRDTARVYEKVLKYA